jgi:hypothetical protein
MAVEMERESMITEAHNAPVTAERRVRSDLETTLPKPCKFFQTRYLSMIKLCINRLISSGNVGIYGVKIN